MTATKPWGCFELDNDEVHIAPDHNDVIEHTLTDDCVCGPTSDPVPIDDETGAIGWLVIHHSLDGREAEERTP